MNNVYLTRTAEGNVVRMCGNCAIYLSSIGMMVQDELGIYEPAPGVTWEQVRATAIAHHGKPEAKP